MGCDLISTQESVAKIVDTAIRKILNGEQKLTKEYEQSVIEAVNVILDTARRERGKAEAQPEIIRCKECRHRIVNNHYGERGYLKIKGYCELDTGDPFELGRDAGNDDWFCADAEKGEPQHGSD